MEDWFWQAIIFHNFHIALQSMKSSQVFKVFLYFKGKVLIDIWGKIVWSRKKPSEKTPVTRLWFTWPGFLCSLHNPWSLFTVWKNLVLFFFNWNRSSGLKQWLITIAKQCHMYFPYSYPPSSHSPVQLADKHVIYLSIGGIWDIHLAPPLGFCHWRGTEWIYYIPPPSRQIALTYQGASFGETEVHNEKMWASHEDKCALLEDC